MSKILICGGDSWANRGDSAILAGTLESLQKAVSGAEIIVASDKPQETTRVHGVPAVRRTPGSLIKSMIWADLVLWGGGHLLQNASSKVFLLAQLSLVVTAKLLGKPIMVYGQGVGPVRDPISRFISRLVVNTVDGITVRDAGSLEKLKALGVTSPPAYLAADPAILVTAASSNRADAILKEEGVARPFVVIAVRRWGHYTGALLPVRFGVKNQVWSEDYSLSFEGFKETIARIGDYIVEKLGAHVLFLPMCPGGDQWDDAVAADILDNMIHREKGRVLLGEYLPTEIKAVLGQAELVVGMRTHSLILGCSTGTPGVAISYLDKGKNFFESLGLEEYWIPVEEASYPALREMVQGAWDQRAVTREYLLSKLPKLRQQALLSSLLARHMAYQGEQDATNGTDEVTIQKDMPASSPYIGSMKPFMGVRNPFHNVTNASPKGVGATASRKGSMVPQTMARLLGQFDKAAGWWGSAYNNGLSSNRPFLGVALRDRRERVVRMARIRRGDVVLDLGCGSGEYAHWVSTQGAAWLGLDVSPAMLSTARSRLNRHGEWRKKGALLLGEGRMMPLKDASVDVMLCSGVIDYLPEEALPALLMEVRRVLKSNGRLVITANLVDPLKWFRSRLPSWVPDPLRTLGPTYCHSHDLASRLSQWGLHVAEYEFANPSPFSAGTIILGCFRMFTSRAAWMA